MISKYFLDKLKISQEEFTKFVKTRRNGSVIASLAAYGRGYSNASCYQAQSCCGVGEVRNAEGESQDSIEHVVARALTEFRGIIYYANSRADTRKFAKLGFDEVSTFRNPNTGRIIYVMFLNASEE